MNKVSVSRVSIRDANTRPELCISFWKTSRTIRMWPSKNLFRNSLFGMKRGCTTSILSQNNKACYETNKSVKIFISLQCVTPLFSTSTADNRRPLNAQNIHNPKVILCACRVLSLAAIRKVVVARACNCTSTLHSCFSSIAGRWHWQQPFWSLPDMSVFYSILLRALK